MSIDVMGLVWERSRNKGSALLLELYLADCAHEDGTNVFPSVASMAKRTRLSERAVQYLLRELERSGELIPDGATDWGVKRYRIGVQTLRGATDCTQSVIRDLSSTLRSSGDQRSVATPEISDSPPNNHTSVGTPKRERCRIPRDFGLTPKRVAYASQQGLDPRVTLYEFKDYWLASGKVWLDWDRVWQRWCREAAKRNREKSYAHRNGRGEDYQEVIPPPFLEK